MTVKDVMVEEVIAVAPTESAVNVAKIMIEKHINRMLIVDNEKLVSIVMRGDILKGSS